MLCTQFLVQLVPFARRVCEAPVRVPLLEYPDGYDMAGENAKAFPKIAQEVRELLSERK